MRHTNKRGRKLLLVGASLLPLFGASAESYRPEPNTGIQVSRPSPHNFDFLLGTWSVHNHALRIANGKREWLDYDGECIHRNLNGGWGNVDEYLLPKPDGTYHAMAIRGYDPKTSSWAIWWLDERYPHGPLDPPVVGTFQNGVGTFYQDYTADGKSMRLRFTWSHITTESAHWEQAQSADGGKSWETNWTMDFKRKAP